MHRCAIGKTLAHIVLQLYYMKTVLGVDPGLSGAFVLMEDNELLEYSLMPLENKEISFKGVLQILHDYQPDHIYLERAVSFGMGTKSAFNYGRGFAAIEIAIGLSGIPVTYIEPSKWTKIMHEGVSADIKPKIRSVIAFERLFAHLSERIPKSKTGKYHEGVLDALLIAGYGIRKS